MLLFLLVSLVSALPPVRLSIDDNAAVTLLVGNPGVHWRFHLNFSLATIELHSSLARLSQSYGVDHELFYFGDNAIFLPIVFNGAPNHEIYTLKQPVEGTLGLAPGSPLWRHWYNYTYTSNYIQLGEYDMWSQSNSDSRPPVMEFTGSSALLPNGEEIRIRIDLGRVDTYLPAEYYTQPPDTVLLLSGSECTKSYKTLGIKSQSCENNEFLSLTSEAEHTVDGLKYNATKATDNHEITLGMHFMRDKALFVDLMYEQQFFSPSVFVHPLTAGNAVCAILLSAVTMAWLAVVLVGKYGTPWILYLSIQLEMYGYLLSVLAWLGNVIGDRIDLYLANFVKASPAPFLAYTGYSILIGLFTSVAIFSGLHLPLNLAVDTTHLEKYKNPRVLAFTSAVFSAMWICVVHRHTSTVDAMYILFYSGALGLSVTLCTLCAVVYQLPGAFAAVFHIALTYAFLIGSLVPLFDGLSVDNTAAAVLWTVIIIMFSSFAMFANYALDRITEQKQAQD